MKYVPFQFFLLKCRDDVTGWLISINTSIHLKNMHAAKIDHHQVQVSLRGWLEDICRHISFILIPRILEVIVLFCSSRSKPILFSEVTTVNSPQEECLNVSNDNEKERRHLNTAIPLTNATAIFHGFIFLYIIMKEDKDILVLKIYLHIAAIIHSRWQIDSGNSHYVRDTLFLYCVTWSC